MWKRLQSDFWIISILEEELQSMRITHLWLKPILDWTFQNCLWVKLYTVATRILLHAIVYFFIVFQHILGWRKTMSKRQNGIIHAPRRKDWGAVHTEICGKKDFTFPVAKNLAGISLRIQVWGCKRAYSPWWHLSGIPNITGIFFRRPDNVPLSVHNWMQGQG